MKKIKIWLYICALMVFAMAVIGAITRLSEAGLSMVEWRPLMGWIPPLTETEWQRVYSLYQQSPEFTHKHYWMELTDFKQIFFWEWLHRLWGRLIGLVYALPLLLFSMRKQIPAGYDKKLFGILLLGGAQGLLGWWMVKSGLADRPEVSHYRLAAHLGLALILFSFLCWTALDLGEQKKTNVTKSLLIQGWGALLLLATTITWGAFTAGLDAGQIYNSFPLMNGYFTPPESFGHFSVLNQQGWVQFTHRWLAITTGTAILGLAVRTKNIALGAMVFIQIGLGISTLITQAFLPLAALHQAGAIILLALLLQSLHRLQPVR